MADEGHTLDAQVLTPEGEVFSGDLRQLSTRTAVGEVGIQTFPRQFGRGSSTSTRNILATLRDMGRVYRRVFSADYDRPMNHG